MTILDRFNRAINAAVRVTEREQPSAPAELDLLGNAIADLMDTTQAKSLLRYLDLSIENYHQLSRQFPDSTAQTNRHLGAEDALTVLRTYLVSRTSPRAPQKGLTHE